jgi:hypothetical protein
MSAPLREVMRNATTIAASHVLYIKNLQRDFEILAEQISDIYKTSNLQGSFSSHMDMKDFLGVGLTHSTYLFEGRDEELEGLSDDELFATRLHEEQIWEVWVDKRNAKLIFMFGDSCDVGINEFDIEYYNENTLPGHISVFSLDDLGYQDLQCALSKSLSEYLPVSVQLEIVRRADEQVGQDTLKFGV